MGPASLNQLCVGGRFLGLPVFAVLTVELVWIVDWAVFMQV